jgi:ApbE superfamily uncharacterized protein (UPF0280 family)
MRRFEAFRHKEASFRICSDRFDLIKAEILRQRALLEAYIRRQPEFATSLSPLPALLPEAPEVAQRMHRGSRPAGVGPMAAVAGCIAELAAGAAISAGAREAIVENGGDIYIASQGPVVVGLFAGDNPLSGRLAFRVRPAQLPLAICSSSGRMGHSLSFGDCDLATVVSRDACLADAAATLAGNLVRRPEDIEPALERVGAIAGVLGVLIIEEDRVGMLGALPQLVRQGDPAFPEKITRHPRSGFPLGLPP